LLIIAKAAAKPSAGKCSGAKKSSAAVTSVAQLTGKRGTLKRRRQLQQLIDHHQQLIDMDLFSSTPFRSNKLIIKVSLSICFLVSVYNLRISLYLRLFPVRFLLMW